MIQKVCFLLALFILMPVFLFAQPHLVSTSKPQPHVVHAEYFLGKHVTQKAFDIEIDTQGYAYITSQLGVRRFDGSKMRYVPQSPTNKQVVYHAIGKDFYGRLLFYGRDGIAALENDTLKPFHLPDSVMEQIKNGVEAFYRDSNEVLYLAPRGYGYYTISPDGDMESVIGKSSGINGFATTRLPDGAPFHFSILQKGGYNKNVGVYSYYNGETKLITKTLRITPLVESSLVEHPDKSFSLSMANKEIIRVKNDSLISQRDFGFMVSKLFMDSRKNLWVSTLDSGFYQINGDNFETVFQYGQDALAVVAEDLTGGLWIKTTLESFAYIPHPNLLHYSRQNGLNFLEYTFYIHRAKNHIICLAPPRGMYLLGDSIHYVPIQKHEHRAGTGRYDVNPLYVRHDLITNTSWLGFAGELRSWNGTEWKTYSFDKDTFPGAEIRKTITLKDSTVIGTAASHLFKLKNDKIEPITDVMNSRILEFEVLPSGQIWIAKQDGLWKLKNDSLELHPQSKQFLNTLQSYQLLTNAGNSLWVQQEHGNLYRVTEQTLELVTDASGEGISVSVHSIAPNGDLWAMVSRNGDNRLCKVIPDDDGTKVEYFAIADQARKGPLYRAFEVTDKHIYLGSAFGLFIEEIEKLKKEHPGVRTAIRELRINGTPVLKKGNYQLDYRENFLSILFDGISFRGIPVEYRYKLNGLDSNWSESEYQEARYNSLSPGDYYFHVQSRPIDTNDPWGESTVIHFFIKTPFWQTLWFKLAVAGFALVLIALVIYYRSRFLLKKERAKSAIALEMSQLELKALKAQINPHFIFNAMSSATYYLRKNRADDARSYLTRFSRLIRTVLENSEESRILLSKEVELMEQYIALESERFEGADIDFSIDYRGVDPDDIKIPPALFQPYIENAIWHGLKNKEGIRKIKLVFQLKDDQLQVTISDNGIGRQAASKHSEHIQTHRSFGMMIASRRIEILNQDLMEKVEIQDMVNTSNQAAGTSVSFSLPV